MRLRRVPDSAPVAASDAALVALVGGPAAGGLPEVLREAPNDLAARAVQHGIAGIAFHQVRHLAADFPELVAALDESRRAAWSDHLGKLADLAELAEALAPLSSPWAVVKGPVLAERTYGRGDLRNYYDVDLLVHPRAFGEAMDLLEGAGAVMIDRNWELIRSTMPAELALQLHGRTMIDLHWHLLPERAPRRRATWDMGALLDRATVQDVGGVLVPVLDPVDALMHIAVHATYAGGHKLVYLKDVHQQAAAFPVRPDELKRRADQAGVWPATHLALLRAAHTLGEPAPADPPLWSRLNARLGADRFRSQGPAGTGRALAGATRSTTPSSVAALCAMVLRHGHPWARDHGLSAVVPPRSPTLEEMRAPGGSPGDRRAYLEAVARQS